MNEQDQLSGFQPTPGIALPGHRSMELARLTSEAKHLHAQRAANYAEIHRLGAANAAVDDRLSQVYDEIKTSLWDGNPPLGAR